MKVILTKHAAHRIRKRKMLRWEVMDCIRYPDNVCKRYGKYYFQKDLGRGVIEVCCEKSAMIRKRMPST